MTQRSALSTIQSGVAGEYFVAAELARRGYVASLTLRNTRGIDILASNANASCSVGIQVKATQGDHHSWLVSAADAATGASNLFYVFVSMNGLETPRYYVVPRRDVDRYADAFHRKWLAGRKRDGSSRKDTNMRKFADPAGKYLNAWHLLGLDRARA